ncbi:aspartate aminotransferase family protein [Bryobacterales bacterium F-183]|nr:aspartate aminotransferase family protein [Bryobacterales bacterium F-183]
MKDLLFDAASRAVRFLDENAEAPVAASGAAVQGLDALRGSLPDAGLPAADVVATLDAIGSPATTRNSGPRYFGFVTGGTLPAALAANWMATAWDQNAAMHVMSPVASVLEEVALQWVAEAMHLPAAGGVFTTGATMANFTCLAAARHAVLAKAGWDVERDGLFGAPPITVIVGAEAHATLFKSLAMLGLGRERVVRVPVDDQGRMVASAMPAIGDGPTIVCLQAGNVNSGAFDPAAEIVAQRGSNTWVHVDGAFGIWALASPEKAHLAAGYELADSWATDGHKWLNVSYDCGIALVRDANALAHAMAISAAYLSTASTQREGMHWGPESSRKARGIEVWAAMRSLGRQGLAEMIAGCCRHASRFAARLTDVGFAVMNRVELNQVVVSFGTDDETRAVIAAIQNDGTCWCGATVWKGRAAMRISVSSWMTSEADVERSADAMIAVARRVLSGSRA